MRAVELSESGAEEDEIVEAITPEDAKIIVEAHAGVLAEQLAPADRDDLEDMLVLEIGKYLRTTAGGWRPEDRTEFINGAVDDLREYPMSLLMPALERARKREPFPNRLVPAIVAEVEPRVAKLAEEAELLAQVHDLVSKSRKGQG